MNKVSAILPLYRGIQILKKSNKINLYQSNKTWKGCQKLEAYKNPR